jgi:hypothetical protein
MRTLARRTAVACCMKEASIAVELAKAAGIAAK